MLNWETYVITDLQPDDGTNYTLHVVKHVYGGYLVCCNDNSMWLAFKDGEVKHLASRHCWDDPLGHSYNQFTQKAISDYIVGLGLE